MSQAGSNGGDERKRAQRKQRVQVVRAAMSGAEIVQLPARSGGGDPPGGGGHGNGEVVRLLDVENHWNAAGTIIATDFLRDGHCVLGRHLGDFYRFDYARGGWRQFNDEWLVKHVYAAVDASHHRSKDGLVPCRATQRLVGSVAHAIAHRVLLDEQLERPAWLPPHDPQQLVPEHPPATEFLAVQNGLLHLPSGVLWPSTPAFFGLTASPVPWLEDPPEPTRWLAFIDEVFDGDTQAVESFQEGLGYSISLDTSQQKIFVLHGQPRSGKGTLLRVITAIVGLDNVCHPSLASLADKFGLAPLIGRSIAIIGDARLGSKSDHAEVLQNLLRISGEDRVDVARKHRGSWSGLLRVRFWMALNELPQIQDVSNALASRLVVFNCNQCFEGREDTELTGKLRAELPGILRWAVIGWQRLRERGRFLQPESAAETIASYREATSETQAFVARHCVIAPGHRVERRAVYEVYCRFREEEGFEGKVSAPKFGKRLLEICRGAVKTEQVRKDGTRKWFYVGIRLRDPKQDDFFD